MNIKQLCLAVIFTLTLAGAGDVLAKTKTRDALNLSDNVSAMFFWIADPTGGAFFDGVETKKAATDWSALFKSNDQLVVLEPPSGDPLLMANQGEFKLTFDYTGITADVYWAEVFFNGATPVVNASANAHFDEKANNANGKDWMIMGSMNDSFLSPAMAKDINTHFSGTVVTPVPIPSSVVLLLSAIAMVSVTQRRKIDLGRTMQFAAQKTADLGSTLRFAAQTTSDLGSTLKFAAQSESR